jgi:ATP-binding protein involved in chromosome partitioning
MVNVEKSSEQSLTSRYQGGGLNKVKQVLAVASGKGGVGKTTIAVNTALALAKDGCRVGLLDADVYGPSVPVMLGVEGYPRSEHKMLLPVEKFGIKIMSLGLMVKKGEAFVWRGPMVGKAIRQLLDQVSWGELDFLIIDLPPGTGDPSITIAQAIIPKASVLIVTTPQEVALADVRRARAFQKIQSSHSRNYREHVIFYLRAQ